MRLFHLLTEDRVCLNCNQTLDKHMSTGRCLDCGLPHCPVVRQAEACKECHHIYVHRGNCSKAQFLQHPDYPGSSCYHRGEER